MRIALGRSTLLRVRQSTQAGVSMKTLILVLISFFCLAIRSIEAKPQALASAPPQLLVLAGGTIIDVTSWGESARDLTNAVVIIRDGRITDVGPAGTLAIPKGARVVDCTGKFIIPPSHAPEFSRLPPPGPHCTRLSQRRATPARGNIADGFQARLAVIPLSG